MFVDCGGTWDLGCHKTDPWILDAEKFAHRVTVRPFWISRAPVTNAQVIDEDVSVFVLFSLVNVFFMKEWCTFLLEFLNKAIP